MAATTYRELFQGALEEWIAPHGDFWSVVTLVNVYQGSDPIARHYAFEDWLEGASFSCARCGRTFTPDPSEVEEYAVVVCERCEKGLR